MSKEGYLACAETFIAHRINYYGDTSIVDPQSHPDFETLKNCFVGNKPDIVITTATHNRKVNLETIHKNLTDQKGRLNWSWLVIDNLSTDGTVGYLESLKDDRLFVINSPSPIKCAYPVRNMGLDFLSYAYKTGATKFPWISVVDSDDYLHNEYSLHEMLKIRNSASGKRRGLFLVHGYSDTIIKYSDKTMEHVANPRDTSSSFPIVENLRETFYKGLNILAGAFPIELLSWLRYPEERSFEDGGFNEKLMLQAQKQKGCWYGEQYPVTVKVFHRESMSGINNQMGDTAKQDRVGPYEVTGIRADIVSYYRKLMDWFTREQL